MICPKCGETLRDEALFCSSCGTKIEHLAETIAPEYVQPAAVEPETAAPETTNPEVAASETAEPETAAPEAEAPEAEAPAQEAISEDKPKSGSAAEIANKAKAVGGEALNKANAVADTATEAVKKVVPGMNKTILLICCAGLLVIIILCFVIFANLVGGGSGSAFTKVTHYAYTVNNDGELALFIDGKAITNDASYESSAIAYAYNANAVIYGGVLYKVDGSKLTEVNDDVSSYKLSANRNAFVYVSDGGLYIYKDGKESRVFDDFNSGITTAAIAVSPNGNTVAFIDRDDDEVVTYLYKGSKAEKLGKNIYPLSVSDDGAVLYGYKYDTSDGYVQRGNTLYLYKNGKADDPVKIKSDCNGLQSVSKDGKKILFATSSGTYYFAPNLSDAIKVDSGNITPIFPSYTVAQLDDFRSFIALDGSSIKRFTLKGDSYDKYTIASSVSTYRLSEDGKKLVYIKNTNLYSISTTNENAEAVKLAEDISSFSSSADLSKIYAKNLEGELVFSNGSSTKTSKITDDVELFRVNTSGVCCYVVDDMMYTTSGGSKGSKVDKMSDVRSVTLSGGTVFYAFNDDVLYISTNGRSFEKTSVEV